jgi:hypothetical protein
MIAFRISAIVLAAATLALSGTATRATILAVNGGGNTPQMTQPKQDALSDLPKPSPQIKIPSQKKWPDITLKRGVTDTNIPSTPRGLKPTPALRGAVLKK